MKIKQIINKFLCQMDLFSAVPMLRTRSDPYFGTLGLGILSLLIYAFMVWLFFYNVKKAADLDESQVEISSSVTQNFEKINVTNFLASIAFYTVQNDANIPKIEPSNYHDYFIPNIEYRKSLDMFEWTTLGYKICQPSQWNLLGQNYTDIFKKHLLNETFCFSSILNIENLNINVSNPIFFKMELKPCKNKANCRNSSQIYQYFKRSRQKMSSFAIYVGILRAVPQISSRDPIKYVIDEKRYGVTDRVPIVYSSYQQIKIQTNSNLFPEVDTIQQKQIFNEKQQIVGSSYLNQATEQEFMNSTLFSMNFLVVPNLLQYTRQAKKLDESFSYVGGLLGVILLFFSFFLGSYSQYRFQMRVGEHSFNFDSDGRKIREKDLGPIMFSIYSIFDWLALLFDYKPQSWTSSVEIDDTRQESVFMLDIEKLFRRIEFLQKVIYRQSDPNVFVCMTLIQPDSLPQTQRKRRIMEYYNKVIEKKKAASVQDAINQKEEVLKKTDNLNGPVNLNILFNAIGNGNNKKKDLSQTQKKKEQICQSLIKDLELGEHRQVCNKIAEYVWISEEAENFKMMPEYEQTEIELTEAFLNLNSEEKMQLMQHIPIKILHRLRLRAIKLRIDQNHKTYRTSQNEIRNNQVNLDFMNSGLLKKASHLKQL